MFEKKLISLPTSPVLRPMKKPHYFREGFCILAAVAVLGQLLIAYQYFSFHLQPWNDGQEAANSTLGFGSIIAVSRKSSSRRHSLMTAAKLTSLDIMIPIQPIWQENDITSIQAPENSTVDRGSALAWLGHRNALEHFLHTNDETALIMEDDVDWDVRVRQDQIPQTAYAIRELLDSQYDGYYGDTSLWDIIWLGHCGDYFDASRGSDLSTIKSFEDPAMPDLDDLHPWTKDFMQGIGATQNRQRLVHESVRPLCTFAYAVTRSAAQRVLNEIAISEPIRDAEHPCSAFDVRMLEGCRDEGLKCITVNPELFHHSPVSSEIAQVAGKTQEEQSSQNAEEEIQELVETPTTNIRCSARSKRWKDIQDSISDPSVDAEAFVRELAERSSHCHIDDLK